jgi:hypothetical protein
MIDMGTILTISDHVANIMFEKADREIGTLIKAWRKRRIQWSDLTIQQQAKIQSLFTGAIADIQECASALLNDPDWMGNLQQ